MAAVEFDTREYEFSHGRTPRGRGSWAFFSNRKMDVQDNDSMFWSKGSTTYVEAKKQAREWAKSRGVDVVYVGS